MQTQKKHRLKQLRQWRIRKKVVGSKDRPRMAVCFTGQHIYVQFIDDIAGATLAAASTLEKDLKGRLKTGADQNAAKEVGKLIAERAVKAGIKDIKAVVFDRGGALYHGKVKALADAAREAGLKF